MVNGNLQKINLFRLLRLILHKDIDNDHIQYNIFNK
ncbi:hypothetical protein BH09BAC4_BH09BAC4_36800 [soil metagenome]